MDTVDPSKYVYSFNGSLIGGYMDGTMIEISRDEDSFMLKVGADGKQARSMNLNRAGKIKVTLMQTSPSNDVFAAALAVDELTGAGTGAVLVQDLLGRSRAQGGEAYVLKPADVQFGKEILGREWTVVVPNLNLYVGGNETL
jgi:hypothetical protein